MILEAIFNGEIYPAETVVPKSVPEYPQSQNRFRLPCQQHPDLAVMS